MGAILGQLLATPLSPSSLAALDLHGASPFLTLPPRGLLALHGSPQFFLLFALLAFIVYQIPPTAPCQTISAWSLGVLSALSTASHPVPGPGIQ